MFNEIKLSLGRHQCCNLRILFNETNKRHHLPLSLRKINATRVTGGRGEEPCVLGLDNNNNVSRRKTLF